MKKKQCIIFGASEAGRKALEYLKNEYEVIAYSDNNSAKWNTKFYGIKIISPEMIVSYKETDIIIASMYYSEINQQLHNMGINAKILLEEGNDNYSLHSINSGTTLFENCNYDTQHAINIAENFSINYKSFEMVDVKNTEKNKELLSVSKQKKVLICAYIFPPFGGSGVQRTLKFAKYLGQYGYEPIVLTTTKDSQYPTDTSLLSEIPDVVTIIRIEHNFILPELLSQEQQTQIWNLYSGIFQSYESMEQIKARSTQLNASKLLIPDKSICWVNECLKKIETIINLNEIDVVYTTGNPYSDFILGYYIKKKYKIPWVMDYRDPWCTNQFYLDNYHIYNKETMDLQKLMEQQLVSYADAIIVAAEPWKEDFINEYQIAEDKLIEITNGYDEADFKGLTPSTQHNKKFTLCHNGRIYIDRNPIGAITAINTLIEEQCISSEEICFIFNGEMDAYWKQEIEQIDIYNIVKFNGYLSHKDSIVSAMSSDLLVIYGAPGEGGRIIYPGKFYEYLRIGKPILGFSNDNSIIKEILQKTNLGKNFNYTDIEGSKQYIKELYLLWKNDSYTKKNCNKNIQKYSREYATKQLTKVLNTIITAPI